MRILIVDDNQTIVLLLSSLLKKWGHEVVVAENGELAWQLLQHDKIQFVISDWMMPCMDGATLCRKIRGAGFQDYVYFIMITAIGKKGGIVEGMEAGADDYLSKPFDSEELRVRINAGCRLLHLESELLNRNKHLAVAYKLLSRDLEAAAIVQRNLLPDRAATFGHAQFDWLFVPTSFVAGDILDYFRIMDHHVAFYQLDVSGHGVPSAMLSVTLSKFLQPELVVVDQSTKFSEKSLTGLSLFPPEKTVSELNTSFLSGVNGDFYFTMVYAILNLKTGELTFCQAGHPNPIFMPEGGAARLVGGGGFPVGLLPEAEYESCSIVMGNKDRFFLYSDGMVDCECAIDGEIFGEERLIKFIEDSRLSPVTDLNAALKSVLIAWRGGETFEDDISFLAVELNSRRIQQGRSEVSMNSDDIERRC